MLLQEKKNGRYIKPSWLGGGDQKTCPATASAGTPCLALSLTRAGPTPTVSGHVQPLKKQGAAIRRARQFIYPINRVKQTPLDAFTVVDVMRNTLGVGPCQHILDLEGQKAEYKGHGDLCGARDGLTAIYENKQQKEQTRDKADKILDDALTFVKHIRGRITRLRRVRPQDA